MPDKARRPDSFSEHAHRSKRPIVSYDHASEPNGTCEIHDATRHVVNVDLDAEPGWSLWVQAHRAARSPDEAPFGIALDDKTGVDQRVDQGRDRRLGEASSCGQLCARTVPGDAAIWRSTSERLCRFSSCWRAGTVGSGLPV